MCGRWWLSSLKQIANSSGQPLLELNNDVFREALRRYLSNAQAVFRQDPVKEEKRTKITEGRVWMGSRNGGLLAECVLCVLMCLQPAFQLRFFRAPSVYSTLVSSPTGILMLRKRSMKGGMSQLGPPKWKMPHMKPARLTLEITKAMGGRRQDFPR